MNKITLEKAKGEAKRFLVAVAEMEIKLEDDDYAFHGCPESSALKRASMDLTRALSKLRSPG